ncbi:MAG: hypothetical protein ACE5IG_02895 [Dehalococcoidia bacterium]
MADRTATLSPEVARISLRDNWWIIIPIAALIAAIQSNRIPFLLYVHLFSGLLWTGTDIFMGFILGPILRKVDLSARRAIITRLMPRMLFYMPTVATVTITAGYYLAQWMGFFLVPYPAAYWVLAAGTIAGIMIVQGLGVLLPINIRVFLEIRKEHPDGEKIGRLMGIYIKVVASQAVLQFAIIGIMVKFRMGL